MIPTATAPTERIHTAPDPSALLLLQDLKRNHSRLELLSTTLDAKATPQGVADAIHDALAALSHAMQLQEAVSWGWNG